MKNLDLIFTRDFSLCVSEFWHTLLSVELKKFFGIGINRQLMYFDGRAVQAYRETEEMEKVKQYVISKSIKDKLFLAENVKYLAGNVKAVKKIIKKLQKSNLQQMQNKFLVVEDYFRKIYPAIVLSVFLPSVWKDDFLKLHPDGKEIINRWYKARVISEGTFEIIDGYWRLLIKKLLNKNKINSNYFNQVTFSELKSMMAGGPPPNLMDIKKRSRGYIIYMGKLYITVDFNHFLKKKGLIFIDIADKQKDELIGQVANKKGLIKGTVQIMMNNQELINFKKGNILVTSMTSPDFIQAMKDSVAIITDEGGITCHAAIVSRELNKPCIIGTRHATKIFKDGDKVLVDANNGIIKKL